MKEFLRRCNWNEGVTITFILLLGAFFALILGLLFYFAVQDFGVLNVIRFLGVISLIPGIFFLLSFIFGKICYYKEMKLRR